MYFTSNNSVVLVFLHLGSLPPFVVTFYRVLGGCVHHHKNGTVN